MKKTVLIVVMFLGFAWGHLNAQDKKEALMSKVSGAACECIEVMKEAGEKDVKTIAQKCMMEVFMENIGDIMDAYGPEVMQDAEKAQQIGMELSKVLMKECPAFVDLAVNAAAEQKKDNEVEVITEEEEEEENIFEGSFVGYKKGNYTVIELKSENSVEKFLWLGKFEGDDVFLTSKSTKSLKGKKMEIKWTPVEVFDKDMNTYINMKEIRSLELVD